MKKINLALFLLFISNLAFAQAFNVDSLPKQGILLNKGWKWHTGDSPDFAKPDFDDSAWESIDPTKDIFKINQVPKTGEICWLRIKIGLDSSIKDQLAMMIKQSVASEIYVNGKLIKKNGDLSQNKAEIKAFNPMEKLVPFPIDNSHSQTLAIRFAFQPNTNYSTHFGFTNPLFRLKINTSEQSNSLNLINMNKNTKDSFLKSGFFCLLFLLFGGFFIFFPSRKVNLYFSIYGLLSCLLWYNWVRVKVPDFVERFYIFNNLMLAIQAISFLFMLNAVYMILEQPRKISFWFLVIFGLFTIPAGAYIYGWGWFFFGFGLTNLTSLEISRVALISYFKGNKGALIIIFGGICYVINWILFCLGYLGIFTLNTGISYFDVSLLSIPVAFAIFLGYNSGITNRLLEQKLVENESLFAEKQQILATQNETLEKQVEERTKELQASQNQLIQKEKLASLGELTAGIAHEIQNPLNFVNNFSELSVGIAEDLKEELRRTDLDKKYIDELLIDLSTNQEKINHHGKRASSIVKGMLEHSRASTGERALTDINTLCDEYLRLSYHGMRAKDKDFNADFKTDFDENLPKINVIPQDLGRVLLNLINNAFYAVSQRNLQGLRDLAGFTPMVSISTKTLENFIEIKVKDNGNGIPKENLEKIFQPFFTTKPTGEGTGLGLSLSYDIITKGHGGTLEVESIEGEGTTFIVKLAIN